MALGWMEDLRATCFGCHCAKELPDATDIVRITEMNLTFEAVYLLVTPLGGLKGIAGYHTSVMIRDEEYCFTPQGIVQSRHNLTHDLAGESMRKISIGSTAHSGASLVRNLDIFYRPGTYDILRKNCNSFSDCALFFLCRQRMWAGFRVVEQIGAFADASTQFVQTLSSGSYVPNGLANNFDLEDVIAYVKSLNIIDSFTQHSQGINNDVEFCQEVDGSSRILDEIVDVTSPGAGLELRMQSKLQVRATAESLKAADEEYQKILEGWEDEDGCSM